MPLKNNVKFRSVSRSHLLIMILASKVWVVDGFRVRLQNDYYTLVVLYIAVPFLAYVYFGIVSVIRAKDSYTPSCVWA